MPKKLTDAEFKTKANKVHHNKYKYPEAYINSSTPINIFCSIEGHGLFKQRPNDHINKKQGCPQCGDIKAHEKTKNSLKQIVHKFVIIHGNLYDYSYVKKEEIVNNKSIIKIWCNQCKIFFKQKINNHLNKQGCPSCWENRRGRAKKIKEGEFLKRANEIHNNKYEYPEFYINGSTPMNIFCPVEGHGIFRQNPSKHINQKRGCPKCAKNRKLTPEIFKQKAEEEHGIETYDYSNIIEIPNNKTKLPIGCNKGHGIFWQKPNDHMNGYGCPICGNLTSKMQKQIYESLKQKMKTESILLEKKITLDSGKHCKADICFPEHKIVIEYNGDYWHCNPKKYPADYYNSKIHMLAKDIWKKDKNRKQQLEKLGYKVIVVWEADFKKNKEKTIQNLVKEIKSITYPN